MGNCFGSSRSDDDDWSFNRARKNNDFTNHRGNSYHSNSIREKENRAITNIESVIRQQAKIEQTEKMQSNVSGYFKLLFNFILKKCNLKLSIFSPWGKVKLWF